MWCLIVQLVFISYMLHAVLALRDGIELQCVFLHVIRGF